MRKFRKRRHCTDARAASGAKNGIRSLCSGAKTGLYATLMPAGYRRGMNKCHMRKNYNYKRRKLFLPEYGRHIQEMVDSLLEIEDRRERTRQAKAVIAVMGNLNPLLRDTADFTHKLWDHLFIMSDFQLDVDSPYPRPSRQDLTVEPRRMEYPQTFISHKHYGKYIGRIIRSIAKDPDIAGRSQDIADIARFMSIKSTEYNQEHPNAEVVSKEIFRMSGNVIEMDEESLNNLRSEYKQLYSSRMNDRTAHRNYQKKNRQQQQRQQSVKSGNQQQQSARNRQQQTSHKTQPQSQTQQQQQ